MRLLDAAARLRDEAGKLDLDVAVTYNPLDYAWAPHEAFVRRYGAGTKRALLLGMNPGPHGMAQTGVPFGDVTMVRDWMGITGDVRQPARLHPKRPITGFATTRKEPSGTRLYGWARDRFGTAARFFESYFIVNYCPLLFFDEAGTNLTPPQLRRADQRAIEDVCDRHLVDAIRILEPDLLVGVGGFAEARLREVAARERLAGTVGSILHPSPASPAANRGWAQQAEAQLRAMGAPLA